MLVFLIVFVVLCLLVLDMKKPKNFPKGPMWFPIVGSALSVVKSRNKTGMLVKGIKKLSENISGAKDVIGFKIGKDKVVFTISTEATVESLLNQDLDGRPKGMLYETRTWNLRRGLTLTDGDFWKKQRRFVVKHLKNFGYAREGMRKICENEAEFCLNDIRKLIAGNDGKSVTISMPDHFCIYILNSLWLLMAGIRYDEDNKDLDVLKRLLHDLFKSIDMMGALFSHFPFLRFIAPEASGYKNFVSYHKKFHAFIREELENHKKTFRPSDEPRDLIDAYLKVLYSGDEDGKVDSSFSELQLQAVCLDMFMAGTETTNKSMNFMFLNLIRNPELQQKARQEIDGVIGRNRLPTLNDRTNLPFCEAVVMESIRTFMSLTCGIAHRALKNTTLCGYDIPEDTMVISMFLGNCSDPRIIKNPFTFDPNNFLDENGKLSIPENYYPFGTGRHRCIADVLAKSNLFMVCTTILQNFYLEIPADHPTPSNVPVDGATPTVQQYKAKIILRN